MTLINLESLKDQLSLEGITHELTDVNLQLLLDTVVKELIGYTNVPINPITRKTIIREFSSDIFELDYYPVKCISSLEIGSVTLTSDDYVLDESLGIIYFNDHWNGMLVVEYVTQVDDQLVTNLINPLICDIVKYRLTTNFSNTGVMSSVKEGDVQVNYDTSTDLGNLIQSRINNLKASYSIRIRML